MLGHEGRMCFAGDLDLLLPSNMEIRIYISRPAQLAELLRSEFDPELFSHSAYAQFFCDIRDKSAVFNFLRQNETTFDIGNG